MNSRILKTPEQRAWEINFDLVEGLGVKPETIKLEVAKIKEQLDGPSLTWPDHSINLKMKIEFNALDVSLERFCAYVALGADVNDQDYFGKSLLHMTVEKINKTPVGKNRARLIDIASWLIHCGANIELENKEGTSPKELAEKI